MLGIKTVLLVENDLVALTMYRERLQREGFHVETAEDGRLALELLSSRHIDVVVLDLMLPVLNGTEVFKRMRSDPRLKETPVVIFSNATLPEWPSDLSVGPTKSLAKSETTFAVLLQNIQDCLATAPMQTPPLQTDSLTTSETTRFLAYYGDKDAESSPDSAHSKNPAAAFLRISRADLPKVREDCFAYIKAPNTPESRKRLAVLRDRVQALAERAKSADCARIQLLTFSFQAMLTDLVVRPAKATPSILQTIAQAVDCLGCLLDGDEGDLFEPMLPPQALVVDDDPISNQVNVSALQQANFETTSIEDPLTALQLLESTPFDLIVLDVNMPQLTGFEVCERLRRLPQGKTTPVIFLTAFSNFENRKQSVLSGGGDFISKPVSTRELALKSAIHLLKSQLQATRQAAKASAENLKPVAIAQDPIQPAPSATPFVSATESATSISEPAPEPAFVKPLPDEGDVFHRAPFNLAGRPQEARGEPSPVIVETCGGDGTSAQKSEGALATGVQESHSQHDMALRLPALEKERDTLLAQVRTVEAELESMCNAHTDAKNAAETAAARATQLESELSAIRVTNTELEGKLKLSETAAGDSRRDLSVVEQHLRDAIAELDTLKVETARQKENAEATEARLRRDVESAQATENQVRIEQAKLESRCNQLTKEIADLRTTHEDVMRQQEQRALAFDRIKSELAQLSSERTRVEEELRHQIKEAHAARDEAQALAREKEEWAGMLDEELAVVRGANETLKLHDQQLSAEVEQLKIKNQHDQAGLAAAQLNLDQSLAAKSEAEARNANILAELAGLKQANEQLEQARRDAVSACDALKAQIAAHTAENEETEVTWRAKLEGAESARQLAENLAQEKGERSRILEEELASIRSANETLKHQEQQLSAEVEQLKVKSQHDQAGLAAAQLDLDQSLAAKSEAEARNANILAELAGLKQANEQLEQARRDAVSECDALKAQIAAHTAENEETEVTWRARLEAAETERRQAEGLAKEKDEWGRLIEEELTSIRQQRDAFQSQQQQLSTELEQAKSSLTRRQEEISESHSALRIAEEALTAEEDRRRALEDEIKSLQVAHANDEARQQQDATNIQGLESRLSQLSEERNRAEAGLRQQLEAAQAAVAEATAAREAAEMRQRKLELELSGRQEAQDQSARQLLDLQSVLANLEQQRAEAEKQAREQAEVAARVTVELGGERERREHFEERAALLGQRLRTIHEELGRFLNPDVSLHPAHEHGGLPASQENTAEM